MNFEAFLHFQEKHRSFLEEEAENKLPIVRTALPSDVEAIIALLPYLWPDYPLEPARTQKLVMSGLEPNANKQWLVALLSGEVLGAISLHMRELLWHPTPLLHIEELIVHPKAQRKGLGRRLMRAAEQFAREHGCTKIELDSGLQRHEAHTFYQAMGYEIVAKFFSKEVP